MARDLKAAKYWLVGDSGKRLIKRQNYVFYQFTQTEKKWTASPDSMKAIYDGYEERQEITEEEALEFIEKWSR